MLPALRRYLTHSTIQYNTIDTPLMGLFSDNAKTPIRINYTINIITTYYTKCVLKLNYNLKNMNEILKHYHDLLFNKKSVINFFQVKFKSRNRFCSFESTV